MQVSHGVLTICPRHRAEFGIRWRCRKIKCTVPEEVAAHKSATSKADRRVNSSIRFEKHGKAWLSWIT